MTDTTPTSSSTQRRYDEFLVTLVMAGDRAAAERLAVRWQPRLARTARRFLGNEEQALEAVQETWISTMRGIGGLRDPARFPAWTFNILRRRCADRIRSAQRMRSHESALENEVVLPSSAGDALAIRQAFAKLPSNQRFAAQLYFAEGLTLAEIAEVQKVPLGTAKTRLFHARRKLKAALSGDET